MENLKTDSDLAKANYYIEVARFGVLKAEVNMDHGDLDSNREIAHVESRIQVLRVAMIKAYYKVVDAA